MIRVVSCVPVWETYWMPPFGEELRSYLGANIDYTSFYKNICGYNLLWNTLRMCELPYSNVVFGRNGKPYFEDVNLFFDIAGNNSVVAVSVSDNPTSVAIARENGVYTRQMYETLLAPHEKELYNGDFVTFYLRKAALQKLVGVRACPDLQMADADDPRVTFFHAAPYLRRRNYRLVAAFAHTPSTQPDPRVTYVRVPV